MDNGPFYSWIYVQKVLQQLFCSGNFINNGTNIGKLSVALFLFIIVRLCVMYSFYIEMSKYLSYFCFILTIFILAGYTYMSKCNWQYSYFYYILSILLYAVITFLIFDNCNWFCGNMYTYIIILMDHIHIFHMSNF